ncbi:hypothetical protein JI735_32940 [Paenibacillus sonchi]|uniref:Uncharacterized protein n=1 Tax=Paenibacillus sonchi TaxID=373687 RepID=A0A974SE92_9BACL|nr:hypothetical protein [Paenibacillus sonchi]QQZ61135.1 hypothetical protein JI735_32940 [Paenibacillus sonchi]
MFTALYRTFNSFPVNVLYELNESSSLENSEEWITDLSVNEQNITLEYFRTFRSVELLYDFITEQETPEILSKTYKASCSISLYNKRIVIYGSKAACSNLERYLEKKAHIKLFSSKVEMQGILNKISTKMYQIKSVEYCNVEFLNVNLNSLTLNVKTNIDAQQILSKVPSSPSKTSIEIYYGKTCYKLNIDFINGSMKLNYDSFKSNDIEDLKELILSFFEEE